MNRKLITRILSRAGHHVEAVEDGQLALDAAVANNGTADECVCLCIAIATELTSLTSRFDAILLDVDMPKLTGDEAASRMRAAGVRAPMLALTGTRKSHCLAMF